MLFSALIAAHMATGLVVIRNKLRKSGVDPVFWESLVKYADISTLDDKANAILVKVRKEHPVIMTWDSSTCEATLKVGIYGVAAVQGFFTLIKQRKEGKIVGPAFVKFVRDQHPKIKQGLAK